MNVVITVVINVVFDCVIFACGISIGRRLPVLALLRTVTTQLERTRSLEAEWKRLNASVSERYEELGKLIEKAAKK